MQGKQRPAGAGHVLDLKKASIRGQHLFAANDAGTATEEEKRLAAMFNGGAAADHLVPETPTEYAQRRARENDRRALDTQANDPFVR